MKTIYLGTIKNYISKSAKLYNFLLKINKQQGEINFILNYIFKLICMHPKLKDFPKRPCHYPVLCTTPSKV